MSIHPTAVIDDSAVIGNNVTIGAYAIVGPHCTIGDDSIIAPHAIIEQYTTMGRGCEVSPTAVIGGNPQDLSFGGETSWLKIGDGVRMREGVTIHRAVGEGEATTIGDNCYFMANSHVAHNCKLGNDVILANGALLAGHVEINDGAFISGQTVVHQFVRIGRFVMMGGASGTRQDLPPFSLCDGRPVKVMGINKVGLRRRGFTAEQRKNLQRAYDILWFTDLNMQEAIETTISELGHDDNVMEIINFIKASKRGVHRHSDSAGNKVRNGNIEALTPAGA